MFLRVLNGVLIGILVYLSNGINISTWNHISCNTNTQFLLKFHLENQHTYCLYSTQNPLFSYEVICITRQKDKVEQLPNLWNMENKSRQNVCLRVASCITSVDVHHTDTVSATQLESQAQVSMITIENQLHFFRVLWWQTNFHEKFSFRFCKSSVYSLIFWFFAQNNAERFEWETIVQVFLAIFNLVMGKQI